VSDITDLAKNVGVLETALRAVIDRLVAVENLAKLNSQGVTLLLSEKVEADFSKPADAPESNGYGHTAEYFAEKLIPVQDMLGSTPMGRERQRQALAEALATSDRFNTIGEIRKATDKELLTLPGVGYKSVEALRKLWPQQEQLELFS